MENVKDELDLLPKDKRPNYPKYKVYYFFAVS